MKQRIPAVILVAGILILGCSGSARASTPRMAIHVLASSGPRTIAIGQTVNLHLRVVGIQLDVRHIGKAAHAHQGHIQVYLDRVPRSAYRKPSRQHWLASVGVTVVSLRLMKGLITKGKHRIVAALARNDNVLYHVPTASFKVTVK